MSQSLAAFRTKRSTDLAQLAEDHINHDLNQQDQDLLKSAAKKAGTHASIASLVGLGLGVFAAVRLRTMRVTYFKAFRAMEKPVELRFADGRTEAIPDITNQLAPSKWGDVATYFFFSVAGLFLGGEIGLLTGTASATRTINSDPAAKERIGTALKKFRVDVLKREIKELEGKSTFEQIFSPGS
ncbi:hypothetical protein BDV98DRAFT_532593 [Pterulicium gracile]|uniref:Uncharacterized protein n=1 Tax=Pterulicium gracile TaxID=1884261 RepID=A0A5C3QBV5_9AGAR|nr:hypothetical protein BDV98DRAFT_532593 [Pterula gracilis]